MLEHNPLVIKVKEIASQDVKVDPTETPYEMCGGNYDDAYQMGVNDGQVYLAREILDTLGIKY